MAVAWSSSTLHRYFALVDIRSYITVITVTSQSITMSLFSKLFSQARANVVVVAHGNDKYDVEFDEGAIECGVATVGELRDSCVGITSCPRERVRLLYRGKLLQDDQVKLKSVGIQSGSKVLCMASRDIVTTETPAARAAKKKQEEQERLKNDPLGALASLMTDIQVNLEPAVRDYIATARQANPTKRQEKHDRLAELLLQKLFLLDGITSREGADDAERDQLRQKRKDGVKYTQGLLDEVDAAVRGDKVQADLEQ